MRLEARRVAIALEERSLALPSTSYARAASRLAFVLAGEGVARLPEYDAAGPLGTGELVRVLPEVRTVPRGIFVVHAPRIGSSAKLLRDFLLETAQTDGW